MRDQQPEAPAARDAEQQPARDPEVRLAPAQPVEQQRGGQPCCGAAQQGPEDGIPAGPGVAQHPDEREHGEQLRGEHHHRDQHDRTHAEIGEDAPVVDDVPVGQAGQGRDLQAPVTSAEDQLQLQCEHHEAGERVECHDAHVHQLTGAARDQDGDPCRGQCREHDRQHRPLGAAGDDDQPDQQGVGPRWQLAAPAHDEHQQRGQHQGRREPDRRGQRVRRHRCHGHVPQVDGAHEHGEARCQRAGPRGAGDAHGDAGDQDRDKDGGERREEAVLQHHEVDARDIAHLGDPCVGEPVVVQDLARDLRVVGRPAVRELSGQRCVEGAVVVDDGPPGPVDRQHGEELHRSDDRAEPHDGHGASPAARQVVEAGCQGPAPGLPLGQRHDGQEPRDDERDPGEAERQADNLRHRPHGEAEGRPHGEVLDEPAVVGSEAAPGEDPRNQLGADECCRRQQHGQMTRLLAGDVLARPDHEQDEGTQDERLALPPWCRAHRAPGAALPAVVRSLARALDSPLNGAGQASAVRHRQDRRLRLAGSSGPSHAPAGAPRSTGPWDERRVRTGRSRSVIMPVGPRPTVLHHRCAHEAGTRRATRRTGRRRPRPTCARPVRRSGRRSRAGSRR